MITVVCQFAGEVKAGRAAHRLSYDRQASLYHVAFALFIVTSQFPEVVWDLSVARM